MPSVEEDIQYLIQIVKKDMEITEKKKLLESVPARIKAIDRQLKKMDEDVNETRRILDKLESEKRRIDLELKTHQKDLEKKKEEQRLIRENKPYQALMVEIGYINKKIDQAEERMLVILEEGEARRKEVGILTDRINRERDALVAEKKELEREMEAAESAMKILEDEKIRILPHISEGVRRLYNRILAAKGDSGVANLEGDICQGCYSRVPLQKAHEVRRNDQILKCEVCGRILVYYEVK